MKIFISFLCLLNFAFAEAAPALAGGANSAQKDQSLEILIANLSTALQEIDEAGHRPDGTPCESIVRLRAAFMEFLQSAGESAPQILKSLRFAPNMAISQDGKFRAYSVDISTGGTMGANYVAYQYASDGRNFIMDFADKGAQQLQECVLGGRRDCDYGEWALDTAWGGERVIKIFKVKENLYLVYGVSKGSSKLASDKLKAVEASETGIKMADIFHYVRSCGADCDCSKMSSLAPHDSARFGIGYDFFSYLDGSDEIKSKYAKRTFLTFENGTLGALKVKYSDKYPDGELVDEYQYFKFDGEKFTIESKIIHCEPGKIIEELVAPSSAQGL
ncbi:hypothetical protein [uncultured Campylobacter sp.]|uniref:hypothetical protein n=1 Tax=uncultured Campylobacter sp. TaxID=218934 RepID=UPI0026045C2C|nr:hypothetical protein [uncultured Campylobacter sp.]